MGFSLTKTIQLLGYPHVWKPPYWIIISLLSHPTVDPSSLVERDTTSNRSSGRISKNSPTWKEVIFKGISAYWPSCTLTSASEVVIQPHIILGWLKHHVPFIPFWVSENLIFKYSTRLYIYIYRFIILYIYIHLKNASICIQPAISSPYSCPGGISTPADGMLSAHAGITIIHGKPWRNPWFVCGRVTIKNWGIRPTTRRGI